MPAALGALGLPPEEVATGLAERRPRPRPRLLQGHRLPLRPREAAVIDALRPGPDEMVLPKTSSSLFNSTVFEYLMSNIGIDTVVATGFLTDQCVDHTIRDGADRGFRMVCAPDACTRHSAARHENALAAFKGYCRIAAAADLVRELQRA